VAAPTIRYARSSTGQDIAYQLPEPVVRDVFDTKLVDENELRCIGSFENLLRARKRLSARVFARSWSTLRRTTDV